MDRTDIEDHERTVAKIEAKLYDPADPDDPRWVYRWLVRARRHLQQRYRALERRALELKRKARKKARTRPAEPPDAGP